MEDNEEEEDFFGTAIRHNIYERQGYSYLFLIQVHVG